MGLSSRHKTQTSNLYKEAFPKHFSSSFIRQVTYNDPTTARTASSGTIRSIAWNSVSTLVATGGPDRTLRVWNPERNNVRNSTELKGHTAPIEKVSFNPIKEAELCSVSRDGVVRFWDVRTRSCFNEVKGLGDTFGLAWSPQGDKVVVGNDANLLYVLSPTQSTPTAHYQEENLHVNQITFCWSGTKIFLTTSSGKIRILGFPSFQPIYRLPYFSQEDSKSEFSLNGHTSSCLSAELQPTGRHLATGGSDSVISLWDTADWICQKTITTIPGPIRSISRPNPLKPDLLFLLPLSSL